MLAVLLSFFFIVMFLVSLSIARVGEALHIRLAAFQPIRPGKGKNRRVNG